MRIWRLAWGKRTVFCYPVPSVLSQTLCCGHSMALGRWCWLKPSEESENEGLWGVSIFLFYFYTGERPPEVASLCNNLCVESNRVHDVYIATVRLSAHPVRRPTFVFLFRLFSFKFSLGTDFPLYHISKHLKPALYMFGHPFHVTFSLLSLTIRTNLIWMSLQKKL